MYKYGVGGLFLEFTGIIGILTGFLVIFGTLSLEGGNIASIIQPKAALIVLGGTLAAGMVNYPASVLVNAAREIKNVFLDESPDFSGAVENICELANIVRQEGTLVIQSLLPAVNDPFLRSGLQVSVDINERTRLEEIFDAHIKMEEDKGLVIPVFFESLGGYAPTFGIIGAVIGLIQVMGSIESPSELGAGISTAFVATLYGVGAANLIFLPVAGRLRYKLREKLLYKKIVTQGILCVHKGENPSIIREKLFNYV